MKQLAKALGISVLSASILVGCSSEDATMSSNENNENQEQQEQQEQKDEKQKQEEKEKKEEKAAKAKVEVETEKFGAWKDSIDNVYGSYSAVITNTGDKPASLGSIQINFEGKDGSIIGTAQMATAVPDIVMPGETAYIGETTGLDAASSADEVQGVSVNIDFSPTNEEPMMLDTKQVKLTEGKNEYSNAYRVTGTVVNPNEEKADDIRLAAGLYDADGNFLGTLTGSIQVSLNPDGKAGFELSYPELPEEVKGKAVEAKVKAYNWSF